MQLSRSLLLALLWLSPAVAIRSKARRARSEVAADAQAAANPIRKVVTMLQKMQKTVTEEGEKEEKVFKKMMCYCKGNTQELEKTVEWEEGHIPEVKSDIGESKGSLTQLNEELKAAQKDRDAALQTLREAAAIRDKEHEAFLHEKADYDGTIFAIQKAIEALERGMAGSFLQSAEANTLRKIVIKANLDEADRQDLVAFLSQSEGYVPQSGQIVGILKQIMENMLKQVEDIVGVEKDAEKAYRELYDAKMKEVGALRGAIEAKTAQIGDLGVAMVDQKEDLDGTLKALLGDKGFLANLEDMCEQRKREWAEKQKLRTQELLALAETIKILNDDDALELFKKTLPSTSSALIQLAESAEGLQSAALTVLRKARNAAADKQRAAMDAIVLALTSRKAKGKGGFDKVLRMIDAMVAVLKEEAQDDAHKKEYCEGQFDHAEDSAKALDRSIADGENAIQSATDGLATLATEIKALEEGIQELDKSVQEATETRKEEHEDFKELLAADSQAKELLGFAKARLGKFYTPKAAAPEEEAPALVQLEQQAPPTKEEEVKWADNYEKKGKESMSVMSMLDLLVKDLEKEMAEAEAYEKHAQEEYEKLMSDSAEKRVTDSKSLTEKSAARANLEEELEAHKQQKKDNEKELMATMKYISSLHAECDFLLKYFDVRKEAREGEIDSLQRAKAVLSGADYSMLAQK